MDNVMSFMSKFSSVPHDDDDSVTIHSNYYEFIDHLSSSSSSYRYYISFIELNMY